MCFIGSIYKIPLKNKERDFYLCELIIFFERLDTIRQRWMCRKKWIWLSDHKCCHFCIYWFCMDELCHFLKFFETWKHLWFTRILCATEISSILSHAGEPHDHKHCKEPKDYLKQHIYPMISEHGKSIFFSVTREECRDSTSSNMGKKYNKSIHDTLKERQSNHIPIEYMSHLMPDNSLDFTFFHLVEKPCRNSYKGTIFRCTGRKCIWFDWFIVSYLWHRNMICLSDPLNSIPDNLEFAILTRRVSIEKDYTVCSLCHPSRYPQRDKWSSKTKYNSINNNSVHTTIGVEKSWKKYIYHEHNARKKRKDRDVRKEKKENSFNYLHI